ncbi:hypothetical protein diail_9940 [Diaporthe ilicicola]|nr:hypothetical protein diail_9940 [Diaporthe ilicicola]
MKRRLIGQAINDKAMRDFEPTMVGQIDLFIGQIREASKTSTPVDMTDCLKRLGMDIVGLLAFGFPLNMQTDPTYRFMVKGLSIGGYRAHCFMQFPPIRRLGIQHLLGVAGRAQRVKYVEMMQRMIRTRLSEDKHARHDLYSVVADHLDNTTADGITTSQLWSEALFFFPAGGETTSTALSALFFYLSRNPEIYKKLAKEVRSTFSSDADIRGGSKLAGCRYLRACIDEALRMSPPVSGTPWRELYLNEQDRPLIIDGHVVPPGTQVGVCFYSLHHNEKYFADPFTYRPERWLVDDEAQLRLMNSAFCAFSVGPRGCAGKAMAYLEASLVVAKTIWAFDFRPAPGGKSGGGAPHKREGRRREDEFQLYDIFAAMHVGPELLFTPRGGDL